jgi:hypothetical protein
MRLTAIPAALALTALLAFGLTTDTAAAAPANLPDRPLDIELKEADVKNVFLLLAEVSERKVDLDPCVHGVVDIRLKNTPLPLVYDALAMKLHLVYETDGTPRGPIRVTCAVDGGSEAAKAGAMRVSLAEKNAPLDQVLVRLATAAGLEGVDYRATSHPRVDVTLDRVRAATAMAVLGDETGLKISVIGGKLVVSD